MTIGTRYSDTTTRRWQHKFKIATGQGQIEMDITVQANGPLGKCYCLSGFRLRLVLTRHNNFAVFLQGTRNNMHNAP
jgi:hypothetical protein